MNREIIFRGQSIIGEWFYGLLATQEGKWYISNSVGRPFAYEVRPETISQYIGLKDKNGTKIYEGDILTLINEAGDQIFVSTKWGIHRRKIGNSRELDIPGFSFVVNGYKSFPIVRNYAGKHDTEIMEICGNVFENPELLK